jgi:ABC-type antimicrobial peptide transport system permease subunit
MNSIIYSIIGGLAGYAFVRLAPFPFQLRGKPLNCQMCMAFWFGSLSYLYTDFSPVAIPVGFAAMFVAAFAQKNLEQ